MGKKLLKAPLQTKLHQSAYIDERVERVVGNSGVTRKNAVVVNWVGHHALAVQGVAERSPIPINVERSALTRAIARSTHYLSLVA